MYFKDSGEPITVKAVILDIDGVIIGKKRGFNFPDPHKDVIKKLRQVRQKGIPIALCTAKPQFSITALVKKLGLNNYHITDGGGVIVNPIEDKVIKRNLIDSRLAKEVVEFFISKNTYVEFYTVYDYVIQKSQVSEITDKHTPILHQEPRIVDLLPVESEKAEITKIMLIPKDEQDKERVITLLEPFRKKLNIYWGVHPSALPLQFGVLTALGVSKKQGAEEISTNINVPFENTLGVGDTEGDWQFMEMCKYAAAVGNAKDELKELIKTKGLGNYYIGPSVDENGIIEILDYFVK